MDHDTEDLKTFLNHARIRDCIARLARGEDRRDPEVIRACCWPDSITDYGVFVGNFNEYLAWVVPGSPSLPVTQHVLGQSVIDLDGDTALCETHVISYHRIIMGDNQHRDAIIGGRYLDRLEQRAGAWRIAHRTMLYDWSQDFGESIDWSKGVMGLPFRAPHYSGRAVGDFSEVFFGKRADKN